MGNRLPNSGIACLALLLATSCLPERVADSRASPAGSEGGRPGEPAGSGGSGETGGAGGAAGKSTAGSSSGGSSGAAGSGASAASKLGRLVVTPDAPLRTHEFGGNATFTVALASAPTADVTVDLDVGDTTEGETDVQKLTFTEENWNAPQPVVVTGVAERGVDFDVQYPIDLLTTSADNNYDELPGHVVTVVNQDYVLQRISMKEAGGREDGIVKLVAVANEGRRVVFGTTAGLVPQDTNSARDIYLFDRATHSVELLSVFDNGAIIDHLPNVAASHPAITPDGRFIAFASEAALTEGEPGGVIWDVYVKEMDTVDSKLERVSTLPDHGGALLPSLSADGRYVAYEAFAGPVTWQGDFHAYRYDRQEQKTIRLADDSSEIVWSGKPWLSGDGLRTVFNHRLRNGDWEMRFRALDESATNEKYSISSQDEHRRPSISGDGSTYAFSDSGDMVVRDGATTTVTEDAEWMSFSHDGRYVAFESRNSDLMTTSSKTRDIYVWDRVERKIACASITDVGGSATSDSAFPVISPDGKVVVFSSHAWNLVLGDTNGSQDVFLVDLDETFWSTAEDYSGTTQP